MFRKCHKNITFLAISRQPLIAIACDNTLYYQKIGTRNPGRFQIRSLKKFTDHTFQTLGTVLKQRNSTKKFLFFCIQMF